MWVDVLPKDQALPAGLEVLMGKTDLLLANIDVNWHMRNDGARELRVVKDLKGSKGHHKALAPTVKTSETPLRQERV